MRFNLGQVDLAEGELRGFEVARDTLVLVAKVEGRYKAIDDWCNHAGCLLSAGWIENNKVICPCHEVGFDLDTGRNMTSPGVCGDQRAYRATVEKGELVVDSLDANEGPDGKS